MNCSRSWLPRFGLPRVAIAIVFVAAGCSSSSSDSSGSSDAPADAGVDAAEPLDAGATPEASPPADAGACEVGPAPQGITPLTGGFALLDDAGAGPPMASGGEAKGEWLITKATVWVAESAAAMFDKDASKVEGTAWAVVTDTEVRLDFDLTTTLAGTAAGTLVRQSRIATSGTYTISGTRLVIKPECTLSSASNGPATPPDLELTSDPDGGTGFFITRSSGQFGMVTVVWEGKRRSSP